ncbi:MAG: leucine--tRNA ligase [Thermoplasmatota archaeon]
MSEYDPVEIEEKWRQRWQENDIHKTKVDESKEPFYLIFAYPGISGFLHLGHMRCYSYTDILARYKKMEGYNVLFPAGTHPTGNQAINLSKQIEEGNQEKIDYMKRNGATEEDIERLKDPMELVDYFNEVYKEKYWKKFGISIDFDYFTYTIREDYKQFIKWQFKKLKENDLLTQKPYFGTECVECGPVAVDPSETDLSKGGNAEKHEYTLLKFEYDDRYITAATLRPETVFGQTNLWIDPEEKYVIVKVDEEEWILSEEAAEKLQYQKDDTEIMDSIKGEEMIGDYATAPAIHRDIIILPASFTDPDVGTGIVTSVPSDAPYDWIALKDIKENDELLEKYDLKDKIKDVEPIAIIDSDEWGINPAEKIIDEMGIESQEEEEKLEEATQKIYKAGFHTGTMLDSCEKYEDMRVQQAKDMVKEDMIEAGEADIMYDLSEEVICRCGGKVVVGKIPDQWFIKYSDEELTRESKRHAENMDIKPQSYADNLPDTIEWFQDRSCARMGNWMGTEFPFDEKWVIEAIADSTLYPSYYILAKHYNEEKIKAEQMTEEFFDYVYLGKGELDEVSEQTGIDQEKIEKAKEDFDYWYPLNLNLGGKEHMTVHFPVFLMNHVGILNEDDWPQGIFVNWWLVGKGGKISKSKGGAEPIQDAAEKYGVDTLRLFYAHSSSPFVDKDWSEEEAFNYRKKLKSIWNLVKRMYETEGKESSVDEYLESRFNVLMEEYYDIMGEHEIRKGANVVFYDIPSEIEWYFKRGGSNGELLNEMGRKWVKLMTPFTPHISEELSSKWEEGFVSEKELPEIDKEEISEKAEAKEEYLKDVSDDIKQILEIADVEGEKIHLYVAESWKEDALKEIMDNPDKGMGIMGELVQKIDASSSKLSSFIQDVLQDIREKGQKKTWNVSFDEYETLENNKDFLESQFETNIKIYKAGKEDIYDPVNKSKNAKPRKPAIYVE